MEPGDFEVFDCAGLKVAVTPGFLAERIARPLRNGRYERGERAGLEALLQPDDRVLDLGAGLGVVCTAAGRACPQGEVLAVEANPVLLPMIAETLRLNGVTNVALRHGAVVPAPAAGGMQGFFRRADFWAGSTEAGTRRFRDRIEVPAIALADLLTEFRPTVVSCDIEGGEAGLFDGVNLGGVRLAVIEVHPDSIGEDGVAALRHRFSAAGLEEIVSDRPSTVVRFERPPAVPAAAQAAVRQPVPAATEDRRPWPPADPRILIVTCMKDEGPFILEWVAWHRAMGVSDIVVFSNDCSDGSDALLDRLDEMGLVTHLPNPAAALGRNWLQPAALAFAERMPVFRRADFVISCDVDEFFNVRTGAGRFADLFAAVPPFDVLSVSELGHGANGRMRFEPGPVTEQFPGHAAERPGRWKAQAGVKSILRRGPWLGQFRNHRPDILDGAACVWLDGSGRRLAELAEDRSRNGVDRRGRLDLVSLEHFALRSAESYLVKIARGDVVIAGKRVGRRYWRTRDANGHRTSDLSRGQALGRPVLDRMLSDAVLRRRHEDCIAAHRAMIDRLRTDPVHAATLDWIAARQGPDPAGGGP